VDRVCGGLSRYFCQFNISSSLLTSWKREGFEDGIRKGAYIRQSINKRSQRRSLRGISVQRRREEEEERSLLDCKADVDARFGGFGHRKGELDGLT